MNLGDLLTELYAYVAYVQTDTGGAIRATRWVNQAYQELCDQEEWSFLEATITGTAPLTIADYGQIIDVVDTTNKAQLTDSDHASLVTLYDDITILGTPAYYYLTGGTVLNLFPVSTSVQLSVRYTKNPVDLVLATDTPIVPTAFHDLILLGAQRRALIDDSAAGDYGLISAEYDRRLALMRYALCPRPSHQLITGASEDW